MDLTRHICKQYRSSHLIRCKKANKHIHQNVKLNVQDHLYGNNDGSRNRGFRNWSFHSQDAIHRKSGYDLGSINLSRQSENDRTVLTMSLRAKCECFLIPKLMYKNLIFQLSEHFRDWILSKTGLQCCILACWVVFRMV